MSPEKACKIVALFRAFHPKAEIRLAAGREYYLAHMQPLALMAANSLFMNGYLNIKGSDIHDTISMIESSGYTVDSDINLSEIKASAKTMSAITNFNATKLELKTKKICNQVLRKLPKLLQTNPEEWGFQALNLFSKMTFYLTTRLPLKPSLIPPLICKDYWTVAKRLEQGIRANITGAY